MYLTYGQPRSWRVVVTLVCVFSFVMETNVSLADSVAALGGNAFFPLEASASPSPEPQAASAAPIARISSYVGAVGVRNSSGWHGVVGANVQLYSGDKVITQQGRCEITFTDGSLVRLDVGANITIEERPAPSGGILRTINQYIGNLWFNIQHVTGTETHLATPTAVAAIRGTQGWQEVPNENQSTHGLTEGVEQITERVTQQSVTIHGGQQVTAIRGVGFSAISAITAVVGAGRYPMTSSTRQLPKPSTTGQQNVPPGEQSPALNHVSGINGMGVVAAAAATKRFPFKWLILGIGGAIVAGVIIGVKESGGHPPAATTVGGPTVGVGAPGKR